jgi:hypothetical protein
MNRSRAAKNPGASIILKEVRDTEDSICCGVDLFKFIPVKTRSIPIQFDCVIIYSHLISSTKKYHHILNCSNESRLETALLCS